MALMRTGALLALTHTAACTQCGTKKIDGYRRLAETSPTSSAEMVTPLWDMEMKCSGAQCVDASLDHKPRHANNSRWTMWAVPEGPPPADGWPVFVDFLVYQWAEGGFTLKKEDGHCGNGWEPSSSGGGGWGRPPPPPPNLECHQLLNAHCPEESFISQGLDGEELCKACVDNMKSGMLASTLEETCAPPPPPSGFRRRLRRGRHSTNPVEAYCSFVPKGQKTGFEPFGTPKQTMASCFDESGNWKKKAGRGGSEQFTCDSFYQWAGQLWNARFHQYLVANGIAVLLLNPYEADTWEWATPDRKKGSGLDQPFLSKLVSMFEDGTYGGLGKGTLNPKKLIPSGYSAGAQMASWMIELQARGSLPPNMQVAAAVFLAGGSHMCYQDPPLSLSQCKSCTTGGMGFRRQLDANHSKRQLRGGGFNMERGGCSTSMALEGKDVSCEFCCPTGVTEMYYVENPDDYKTHPPCFLAQTEPTGSDFNADLCASKNYYDTLKEHGVDAEIVYLSKKKLPEYCVGNADNPAATGSPYLGKGSVLPKEGMMGPPCVDHVSAFADMVEPATRFLLCVLHGDGHEACGKSPPSPPPSPPCASVLQKLCGSAKRVSTGNCLVCTAHGSNAPQVKAAGCAEADFDSFC